MPNSNEHEKKPKLAKNTPFTINDSTVPPGERLTIDLPIAKFYTHAELSIPLQVICGKSAGPTMFISSAIHGDELNGIEITRRLLKNKSLQRLRGTLVVIPVVNVFGIIQHSRYLPDRRDLNRSFPGSPRGSLAARIAHVFLEEVVSQCQFGIDLHTGAIHRSNLPQIRANLQDPQTQSLAEAFGVPVLLHSNTRDGSLREAADEHGVRVLLYEAGEALRFDELSIRAGVRGILSVMRKLDMLPSIAPRGKVVTKAPHLSPFIARSRYWERAPGSGLFRSSVSLGDEVKEGDVLGHIADPSCMFEESEVQVSAAHNGLVIGKTNIPLINEGDALFHIARFEDISEAAASVEAFQNADTTSLDPIMPT